MQRKDLGFPDSSSMAAAFQSEEDVVIVGAGIAGLATSLALHRLGVKSLVLESASSLRTTGFALGIWTNAWKALDALGVGGSLRQHHQLLDGVVAVSTLTGRITAEVPFSGSGHELRRVKRTQLVEALEMELPDGTIRFSSKVVSIEESGYFKLLHLVDGSVFKTKVLIGCDGVNSMVAKWLGLNNPVVSGKLSVRGSAIFPQGHGFASKLFIFAGNGFRAGCIPCDDQTMYWFSSWTPSSIQEKDGLHDNPTMLKQYLLSKLQNAPEMRKVVENTELHSLMSSPLRYRHPWELLHKNLSKSNVCVAGDALHSMTPDLAQGGCAALEDGVVLARCVAEALKEDSGVEEENTRVEIALRKYAEERRWRSFKLVAVGYLVGWVQESEGKIVGFLRDGVFAKFVVGLLLKMAEFDCGEIV